MESQKTKREKIITTYSMWNMFAGCPRKCQYRYFDCLVPKGRDDNLYFGGLIHECLAGFYTPSHIGVFTKDGIKNDIHETKDLRFAFVLDIINNMCSEKEENIYIKQMFHTARSMMSTYIDKFWSEDNWDKRFTVESIEKQFDSGKIINPNTGYASKKFTFSGKVDGIVIIDGEPYLIEHKTAASITDNYIGRLWSDMQISLYTHYVRQVLGINIKGVLYNIILKPTLKQSKGETIDEYNLKLLKELEKAKLGKGRLKQGKNETDSEFEKRLYSKFERQLPESDIEYEQRLAKWFKTGEKFISMPIIISDYQIKQTLDNLWYQKEHLLKCMRDNFFPQRLAECYTGQYRGECPYARLCESGGDESVIELYYERKPPHSELNQQQEKETF